MAPAVIALVIPSEGYHDHTTAPLTEKFGGVSH